eukprot:scaffold2115_cov93-Skeletonema_marinoi.AAC.1
MGESEGGDNISVWMADIKRVCVLFQLECCIAARLKKGAEEKKIDHDAGCRREHNTTQLALTTTQPK